MRSSHSETAMNPGNLMKLPLPQDCSLFGAHDVVTLISFKVFFLEGYSYTYILQRKKSTSAFILASSS